MDARPSDNGLRKESEMTNPDELTPEEAEALAAMESDSDPEVDTAEEVSAEGASQDSEPEPQGEPEEAAPVAESPAEEPAGEETAKIAAPAKPPEGHVPHQALHAEREKRKALEARIKEMEEAAKPKEEVPQYADPIMEPEKYRAWAEYQASASQQSVQQIQQQMREQQEQRERQVRAQQFEEQFKAATPDYDAAIQHLFNARTSELVSQGYAPQDIQQQIAQDANALYDSAVAIGMNPAELAYMQAKSHGYQAPAPAPVSAPVAAPAEAKAKMEATARAQQQTQGAQSSGDGGGQITMAQLANMSEAEIAKLPEDVLERAMGG